MSHNSQDFEIIDDRNKGKEKTNAQSFKDGFILVFGSLLFIIATIAQIRMSVELNEWQGVISQVHVMISVYMVARVRKNGYWVASILNCITCIIALLQVIFSNNMHALPGIVIPLCTIITINIIVFYMRRLNLKAKEMQEIKNQGTKEIIELQEVTILVMAALAETRDNETGKHIQRTKLYVKVLAEYLYANNIYPDLLDAQMIGLLVASAPLHDIGKVGIPDSILLKPGRLNPEEFEVIKQHTAIGNEAIMKAMEFMDTDETFLKYAQEIVLYHHERWDGAGYLEHLKGDEIPISARIMSVADVYDALSSKRIYKEIYTHEEALEIISDGSGTQFDPLIVEAFMACNTTFRDIAEEYREI